MSDLIKVEKFQQSNDLVHTYKKNQFDKYDDDIQDYLTGKKVLKASHLKSDASKSSKFTRILDMNKRKAYDTRENSLKQTLHWGQLKLLLTEIEFLTKIIEERKKNAKDVSNIYFIYAGAAPGHHIYFLQKMFPSVYFELYDPNKFVVEDNDKLKTHVQFFTDIDAEYWKNKARLESIYLAFCSDIRTEPASNENVARNMNMQLKWWQLMNPDIAMFKFRLPWNEGKTEYPDGEIFIQPYPGTSSTETRLIVKKNAKLIYYDNKQYEEACYYHNSIERIKLYPSKLSKTTLNLAKNSIDNCYDCTAFTYILDNYIKVTKSNTDLVSLLKDVEKNVTFGKHTVLSQTRDYLTESLDKFRRMCYTECANNKCNVCMAGIKQINVIDKGFSKATIQNEEKYLESKRNTGGAITRVKSKSKTRTKSKSKTRTKSKSKTRTKSKSKTK